MPPTFGTSCEPRPETPAEARRRERRENRKPLSERMDAFERIVTLCAVRDRSKTELSERLLKDGYDQAAVDEALTRAVDCGLVDDARFADAFIRGRISAGKGIQTIEDALFKHGIDPFTIPGWPEAYNLGEDEEVERAVALLEAHPPRAKDAWGAAFRKLVSRGFSPSVASKASRKWAEAAE